MKTKDMALLVIPFRGRKKAILIPRGVFSLKRSTTGIFQGTELEKYDRRLCVVKNCYLLGEKKNSNHAHKSG